MILLLFLIEIRLLFILILLGVVLTLQTLPLIFYQFSIVIISMLRFMEIIMQHIKILNRLDTEMFVSLLHQFQTWRMETRHHSAASLRPFSRTWSQKQTFLQL